MTTHPDPGPGFSVLQGLLHLGPVITARKGLSEALDDPIQSSSNEIVGPAGREIELFGQEIEGLSVGCPAGRTHLEVKGQRPVPHLLTGWTLHCIGGGEDSRICFWDPTTAEKERCLEGHDSEGFVADFSPEGRSSDLLDERRPTRRPSDEELPGRQLPDFGAQPLGERLVLFRCTDQASEILPVVASAA